MQETLLLQLARRHQDDDFRCKIFVYLMRKYLNRSHAFSVSIYIDIIAMFSYILE
jgi:hypothetical protein